MRRGVMVLSVFCASVAAGERDADRALRQQELVIRAGKTGLQVEMIQHACRGHLLFVTASGNGHCLDLYVFGGSGKADKPLWELSALPGGAGGICHQQMLPYPSAYAGR